MTSIRRTLLIWLLAGGLFAGLAGTAAIYLQTQEEANELFDYQLKQMAFSLRQGLAEKLAPLEQDDADEQHFVVQVWNSEGVRLYLSHPHAGIPDRAKPGFSTVATRDGEWRVFSLQTAQHAVQVAQPMDIRHELAAQMAFRTITPLFFLLPIVGLVVWLTVGRGLQPLRGLAQQLQERHSTALDPLTESDLPEELRPMVASLNDLLQRLKHSIELQRHFIADAAHELRTPLAAVQLQIQNAERAETEAERAAAFVQLKAGAKRSTHLVQQLLTLARQEPEALQRAFTPVNLTQIARDVVVEQSSSASAKHVDLGLTRSDIAYVLGDAPGLRVLIGNLVDNAVRYTPEGGRVDVGISTDERSAILDVCDSGPGIPGHERERVFDRFYRPPGTDVPGSGLGLAIAKTIVESHAGKIRLEDGIDGHGLRVIVALPLAK